MNRFNRALRITQISLEMTRDEPGYFVIPIIAGLISLLIVGVATAFVYVGHHGNFQNQPVHALDVVVGLLALALVTVVSVLARATIVYMATARLKGGHATRAMAWRGTISQIHNLIAWAIMSAVVGTLVRAIENQGWIGEIIGSLISIAWSVVTFFVIPVILFEHKGPIDSVKRSAELFRQKWGEQLIGNGAIGLIVLLCVLVLAALGAAVGSVSAAAGGAVFAVGVIGVGIVASVVSSIFNAALYNYAVTGQVGAGFEQSDMDSAFRQKRRFGLR